MSRQSTPPTRHGGTPS